MFQPFDFLLTLDKLQILLSSMAKDNPPVVVDLTTANNTDSPEIITLDDSCVQTTKTMKRPMRSKTVIYLSDSDSDSDTQTTKQKTKHIKLTKNPPQPTPPLKTKPTSPPPNQLTCPICLETYVNIRKGGTKIVVTRCGHLFCDSCLRKSFKDSLRKCPKCRKTIPKSNTGVIEIFDMC